MPMTCLQKPVPENWYQFLVRVSCILVAVSGRYVMGIIRLPTLYFNAELFHAEADTGKHSQDDVVNRSSTSVHPHHRRLTPDSGVDETDAKSCRRFDEHAFEHTFHGFPSPLQTPNNSSTDSNTSR